MYALLVIIVAALVYGSPVCLNNDLTSMSALIDNSHFSVILVHDSSTLYSHWKLWEQIQRSILDIVGNNENT